MADRLAKIAFRVLFAALLGLIIYSAWLMDERANRTEAYAKACASALSPTPERGTE